MRPRSQIAALDSGGAPRGELVDLVGDRDFVQAAGTTGALASDPMFTTHFIVDGAAYAAAWYATVLGAEERTRITLPDGRRCAALGTAEDNLGAAAIDLRTERSFLAMPLRRCAGS